MQFRVLGRLEVTAGGRTVDLGGPKPRALLAMLLVHPGTVVSADRLIDAVWGERPPRAADIALRTYVSRLRTALAVADPADRLRFHAGGYVLDVAAGELDATEFTRMVGDARAQADDVAVQTLDAALALWRDDAFAEFADIGAVRDEATRLAELRLAAMEQRADLMLGLGRGAEVVAELDVLLRRHPDREQLAILLMRALYTGGRQADGLAVYRNLHRTLVEEFGVEPSEQAQAVHRQMLTRDPALAPAVASTVPDGRLPTLRRHRSSFVGRHTDLRRAAVALRGAPLVTLTGVGGVGKSRLAMELAEQERARFPHGVWLAELAPLTDGGPVSHAFAAALGLLQQPGRTIEETVLDHLGGRTLLLVVDNCEHVLDEAAQLLDSIVRSCRGVTLLATSREPLNIEGEQLWPVPPLPLDDATTLFVHRARTVHPDFDPDIQADAVSEICRGLDGLPLAIELAAARMRVMSAAEMARRLDDSRLLSGGPRSAQPRHQSLAATISWSYAQLSEREQRMFARLSVFAGGADLAGVHGVCAEPGADESDTLELVTALVDKSMVGAGDGTRYRVLETLRAYGRERLAEEGAGAELARRHATYFAELAEGSARGVQSAEEREWVDRIVPEHDNLRAAFEWSMAAGDIDLVLHIITSFSEVAYLRVSYEAATWAERALDLAPADHPLFVACVGTAARGAWGNGDFRRGRRLVALAGGRAPGRGAGRPAYPGDVLVDIAMYEGDVEPAFRYYVEQVRLARAADDPIRLTWTLYYVAVCHAIRRQPDLGVPAAIECVAVADATANPTAMSMARYALGLVLKKAEPERALALFDAAAELAAGVRNVWWHGIALMEAAATRSVHGDPAVAAAACIDVLDHWDRVGDRSQLWLHLRYVMRLLVRLGAIDETAVLHHYLVAVGKQSALDAHRLGSLMGHDRIVAAKARGAGLSLADAVHLARTALQPHAG